MFSIKQLIAGGTYFVGIIVGQAGYSPRTTTEIGDVGRRCVDLTSDISPAGNSVPSGTQSMAMENPSFSSIIFPAWNLHIYRGFLIVPIVFLWFSYGFLIETCIYNGFSSHVLMTALQASKSYDPEAPSWGILPTADLSCTDPKFRRIILPVL